MTYRRSTCASPLPLVQLVLWLLEGYKTKPFCQIFSVAEYTNFKISKDPTTQRHQLCATIHHGVDKGYIQRPVRQMGPLARRPVPPLVHKRQQSQLHNQTYLPIILSDTLSFSRLTPRRKPRQNKSYGCRTNRHSPRRRPQPRRRPTRSRRPSPTYR